MLLKKTRVTNYSAFFLFNNLKKSIPVDPKKFHFYIYLDKFIRYAFIKLYIFIYEYLIYMLQIFFAVKKKRPWQENKQKTFPASLQNKGYVSFQKVYFSFS